MLLELEYNVTSDIEGNFLLYLDEQKLARLSLPIEVKDEISSFAVSTRTTDLYYIQNRKLTAKDNCDLICQKLYSILLSVWKWNYGIPCFRFLGTGRYLDDLFTQRLVFIFFTTKDVPIEQQITTWQNDLRFVTKFTFVADLDNNHFAIVTKDHNFVYSWLAQSKASIEREHECNKYHYNIKKIMHDWFLEDEELVTNSAQAMINEFVYAKNLKAAIPAFLVVPSFHIKRYRKATNILTNNYKPELIMTLPLAISGKSYTIIFPICGQF